MALVIYTSSIPEEEALKLAEPAYRIALEAGRTQYAMRIKNQMENYR